MKNPAALIIVSLIAFAAFSITYPVFAASDLPNTAVAGRAPIGEDAFFVGLVGGFLHAIGGFLQLGKGTIIGPGSGSPPVIFSVSASTSSISATITWTTNEPATSKVVYGFTSFYGNRPIGAVLFGSN